MINENLPTLIDTTSTRVLLQGLMLKLKYSYLNTVESIPKNVIEFT